MWASEQDVPFQFTSIKPCEDTQGGFISLIAAVAASEEFGWPRTRTFLPENTSPPPGAAHVNCMQHLKDHPACAAEHSAMDKTNNCI